MSRVDWQFHMGLSGGVETDHMAEPAKHCPNKEVLEPARLIPAETVHPTFSCNETADTTEIGLKGRLIRI
jgi:hypothetical protein